ncbi:MAG: 6-O-methylguanine DNA methyltransferase [Spirochaetales bacterium]|nr:6-O-methylguanine DNA methyltransferase [Spirochaetales bacterium]
MTNDYIRIEKAIEYLRENMRSQPTLAEVSKHVHISEFHFQRMFSRWAGISPKRYLEYLTISFAKELLATSDESLLSTAFSSGLSGTSRLHDLFVAIDAMSPGEHQRRGKDLTLRYGCHDSPFGRCLICTSERGVCGFAFLDRYATLQADELARFQKLWPEAKFVEDTAATAGFIAKMFVRGKAVKTSKDTALNCVVRGTNFQVKVWEALLNIPKGSVATYSRIANAIGAPKAHRAVANAVGANPIALLIPCHRVIRQTGALGGYRYGIARKHAMLAWEHLARPYVRRAG